MTGVLLLALLAAPDPAQKNVRPKATVEVLDSTAQVDDVISNLRNKKEQQAKPEIKNERPPLPTEATPAPGKDEKSRKDRRNDRRDRRDRERRRRS